MKLRTHAEGLAVPATVATANLPKDTIMAITGNRTVDKAGSNANPVGRLVIPSKTVGGLGTVETKFKELVEIKLGAALTAGKAVKMSAVDGTTGENVVVEWIAGTDSFERIYGVVWSGGAQNAIGEVLTY